MKPILTPMSNEGHNSTGSVLSAPIHNDGLEGRIVREFLGSGIAPDVLEGNVFIVPDLEYDELTREVTETPIANALGWKYTRFGHQAVSEALAAVFLGELGTVWQAKVFCLEGDGKRSGRYFAPKGIGDVPFLPSIPERIANAIAAKHGVEPPEYNEPFWEWILKHPEIPLIITEGAKKALAAISQGQVAVSLFGFTCGVDPEGKIKPVLAPYIENRPIIIGFDEDEKPETRSKARGAAHRLGRALLRSGSGTVSVMQWDNINGKGIDDLIAKNPLNFHQAIADAQDFKQWSRPNYDLRSHPKSLITNQKYLPELLIPEEANLIAIRARRGGGKTFRLAQLAQKAINRGQRVLIITHRVALGKELCRRFGVAHVQHLQDEETGALFGYGVCIDSLHPEAQQTHFNYEDWAGALVIIDEAEQVFWHALNAKTLEKNRVPVLETKGNLYRFVAETGGKIILSDADLSLKSYDYAANLMGGEAVVKPWVIVNEYQPPTKRKAFTYEKKPAWLKALKEKVSQGKRILVHVSGQKVSSKYGTTTLESQLKKEFPHLKILRVDAETTSDPNHPAYDCLQEVTLPDGSTASALSVLLDQDGYDIVICSPSVETGISLEGNWFDEVFALGSGIQTVEGFCQAIDRYRRDVDRHIFVSTANPSSVIGNGCDDPRGLYKSNSEKSQDIQKVFADLGVADRLLEIDGLPSAHMEAWEKFAADHNYGFHHYRECIYKKLSNEGYEVIAYDAEYQVLEEKRKEIFQQYGRFGEKPLAIRQRLDEISLEQEPLLHYDDEDLKDISKEIRQTKEANLEQWANEVVEAEPYSPDEYKVIEAKQTKTKEERLRETKTRLGNIYGVAVTNPIAKADIKGELFSQLQLFYYLTVGREYLPLKEQERIEALGTNIFSPDLNRRSLAGKIIVLELINAHQFLDPDAVFTSESLQEWFDSRILPYRKHIRAFLGVSVSPKTTPIQFAQHLLAKLGLRLIGRQIRRDGNTIREYRYDPEQIPLSHERSLILMSWQIRDQASRDEKESNGICNTLLNKDKKIPLTKGCDTLHTNDGAGKAAGQEPMPETTTTTAPLPSLTGYQDGQQVMLWNPGQKGFVLATVHRISDNLIRCQDIEGHCGKMIDPTAIQQGWIRAIPETG